MTKLNLSVIFPVINCQDQIQNNQKFIEKIAQVADEVIFVDGLSQDKTIERIKNLQLDRYQIIQTKQGRGNQLALGARRAQSRWLLFLHIDSVIAHTKKEIFDELQRHIDQEKAHPVFFTLKFDDRTRKARQLEKKVQWRNDVFKLPYGDQGLLIDATLYQKIGGYNPNYPIMEDVDLILKIRKYFKKKKDRIILLQSPLMIITSAEKYIKKGYLKRSLLNLVCLFLFLFKVHPQLILKLYRL